MTSLAITSTRTLLTFMLLTLFIAPTPGAGAPRELGRVSWRTDWASAETASRAEARPIFLLFQEIPGCQTCVGFGQGPLSHPLLVEAVETEFVPLAIHNNRPGPDQVVLERFREPAWNNPVVRFVDADGRDVIPRKDGVWTTGELAGRMAQALSAAKRPVPAWLELVVEEEDVAGIDTVVYPTHCFWEGECRFGTVDGVVSTRAGFADGEVVEVTYDRGRIDRKALEKEARALGDARPRPAGSFRLAPSSDQKYYLAGSPYAGLDMTPLQALRVNASLRDGTDPGRWLSPRQRKSIKSANERK